MCYEQSGVQNNTNNRLFIIILNSGISGNGQSPARTPVCINYGLLPPGRTQKRTIARRDTPTRCLRL